MHNRITILVVCLAFLCTSAIAQKKDLTPADYGKWQSLNATALSPDGSWAAWRITVEQDNDTTYLLNRNTGKTHKLAFASLPDFSGDNQWVAYSIGLPYKEAEKLRELNKPVENNKMGLLNLQTGKIQVFENVARFQFSRNGKFMAISLTPPKDSKEKGNVLLVRNLTDSSSRTIGNVTSYAFNKNSDQLAYIVETTNKAGNSVELYNLKTSVLKVLASDTLRFTGLQWQKEGDGLAFYKIYSDTAYEEEAAMLYVYANNSKSPGIKIFNPSSRKDFPANTRIYSATSLTLSDDFNRIFFGLREWTAKPVKNNKAKDSTKSKTADSAVIAANSKPGDKTAGVDIWHWKDPEIQPRQKVTYNRDKEQSLLAVWNMGSDKFLQIASDTVPAASITGDREFVVISTKEKYKPAFKEDYADFYLVNATTGQKKLLLERAQDGFYTSPQSSPDGKYLAWFKDKNWWVTNTRTGESLNVTGNINSVFWNTRDDHPATKPPFGMGGWTKGDKELFVYDEYDIWAIKPDGKGARKLTNGKENRVIYRMNRLDFENPWLDNSKALYFSAYGDTSKYSGYARYEKGKVTPLIFENQMVNRLVKAKDADAFLYVKQRYDVSPELYATANFSSNNKLVSTNPQQENYKWGKSELVNFKNAKGKPMQGALFYPANYEPGKKYPMIVYIYETLSNTVHMYSNPSERSAYNTTNFTTAGYFVFRPDIIYDINEPGTSAVNCVIPAVQEVLKTGMIDTAKVGLMGHSWGAYQTSYIITQTDIFKAACAGAPLTDLVSMSMSIYWNSGSPDQKIFETSQGRFDGPWYDRLEEHMRNSPMFNAARIKAPLLVAFGDKDGAVDWHQGIEMYGTMRRMEKPHVMLVYADENHGLAKKENQIDYQKRQKEFFDHYLLQKPAAKWITEGVSYQQKMKEKEKPAQPKQGF